MWNYISLTSNQGATIIPDNNSACPKGLSKDTLPDLNKKLSEAEAKLVTYQLSETEAKLVTV